MKRDIDRAPYMRSFSWWFERTSLMVMVYARNVRVGGGGGDPKELGSGRGVLSKKKKMLLQCYCLEWHTSSGMTATYGIYFHFLCKRRGGVSPFGVEWVAEGPDVTLMVLLRWSRKVQYFIYFPPCTMTDITVLVKVFIYLWGTCAS